MQFELVRLIQTSQFPVLPIPAENKIKGSNWHCTYAFDELQILFEQYYTESAVLMQTVF